MYLFLVVIGLFFRRDLYGLLLSLFRSYQEAMGSLQGQLPPSFLNGRQTDEFVLDA